MKIQLSKAKSPDKFDYILIALLVVMAITSIISIYSTFGVVGTAEGWNYLTKQLMWFVAGFIILGILRYLGNDSIMQFSKIAYWILMACLVLLLIGHFYYKLTGKESFLMFISTINGATSWFVFPGIGSFQPSEFMKIVLIIITAGIIDKHNKEKITDSYEMDFTLFLTVAKWALPPMVLIFLQPDTGVCIIIAISLLAMILCSGIKKQWFIILGAIIGIGLVVFFYMYFFHFNSLANLVGGEYKLKRITSWLNPETDINGEGHQLYMALLVLGSAGLSGHGMGVSLVPIPEAQTDFIFSVIGQSWGLIGTLFIVVLCLLLDLHLCRIASMCKNMFEKYIILGILGLLLYQQAQNMGMIVGLLPITGITLPLISYGGSSLMSYFLAFGIILNASAKARKVSDFTYN